MVIVLDAGSTGPGSSHGQVIFVVHSASLLSGVCKSVSKLRGKLGEIVRYQSGTFKRKTNKQKI